MTFIQIHQKIHAIDQFLRHHNGGEVLSLNPQRKVCTSFEELFESITFMETLQLPSIIEAISILVKEEINHFPNNIFWDKDYFLYYILSEISKCFPKEQERYTADYLQRYVSLLQLFGKSSTIRFQYLHDFSYGFDWAKWVRNDSENRNTVLPFSLAFLQRMLQRGKELEQMICKNDELYPRLKSTEFRNPFHFHRSIECESLLLRQLASKEYIPIIAWEQKSVVDWKKDYSELRANEAKNSGLTK